MSQELYVSGQGKEFVLYSIGSESFKTFVQESAPQEDLVLCTYKMD